MSSGAGDVEQETNDTMAMQSVIGRDIVVSVLASQMARLARLELRDAVEPVSVDIVGKHLGVTRAACRVALGHDLVDTLEVRIARARVGDERIHVVTRDAQLLGAGGEQARMIRRVTGMAARAVLGNSVGQWARHGLTDVVVTGAAQLAFRL